MSPAIGYVPRPESSLSLPVVAVGGLMRQQLFIVLQRLCPGQKRAIVWVGSVGWDIERSRRETSVIIIHYFITSCVGDTNAVCIYSFCFVGIFKNKNVLFCVVGAVYCCVAFHPSYLFSQKAHKKCCEVQTKLEA